MLPFDFFPQSLHSSVYNIHAEEETGASINISWLYDGIDAKTKAFELYRSSKPFAATYEIEKTALIAELPPEARDYSDKVDDYHEYYYAVLVRTEDGTDRILLPSMNATVTGTHRKFPPVQKQTIVNASAQEKIYSEGELREIPLPSIDLLEASAHAEHPLLPQTVTAGEKLGTQKTQTKTILEPYAFEQDLISPEGGEDYLLFDTLHRTFARKQYGQGIQQLEEFLSVNHSEKIITRAYFYLGECQYFSGLFKDAVMSFLKVQEEYPDLTKRWIDSSLDLITAPDTAD